MRQGRLGIVLALSVLTACGSSGASDKVARDLSDYLGGAKVSSCEAGRTVTSDTGKELTMWKCTVEGQSSPQCVTDDNGKLWIQTGGVCY